MANPFNLIMSDTLGAMLDKCQNLKNLVVKALHSEAEPFALDSAQQAHLHECVEQHERSLRQRHLAPVDLHYADWTDLFTDLLPEQTLLEQNELDLDWYLSQHVRGYGALHTTTSSLGVERLGKNSQSLAHPLSPSRMDLLAPHAHGLSELPFTIWENFCEEYYVQAPLYVPQSFALEAYTVLLAHDLPSLPPASLDCPRTKCPCSAYTHTALQDASYTQTCSTLENAISAPPSSYALTVDFYNTPYLAHPQGFAKIDTWLKLPPLPWSHVAKPHLNQDSFKLSTTPSLLTPREEGNFTVSISSIAPISLPASVSASVPSPSHLSASWSISADRAWPVSALARPQTSSCQLPNLDNPAYCRLAYQTVDQVDFINNLNPTHLVWSIAYYWQEQNLKSPIVDAPLETPEHLGLSPLQKSLEFALHCPAAFNLMLGALHQHKVSPTAERLRTYSSS